jgi:hypothetical protein
MNRHRLALLALAALLPFGVSAQQMPLNDTGQDRCYDGADLVACSEANTGDAADYPRQDGRFGRDAQAAAGQLNKIGGGAAGFDFTKLCNNGEAAGEGDCPADPALGSGANDWACTQDNVTGRVWEVKTDDGGLRDRDWTYTWYDSTATNPGTPDGGSGLNSDNCTDDTRCDTEKFVADVNSAQLCGYTDWRLPRRRELLSLVEHDTSNPAIDTDYFPNTASNLYWSADTYAPDPGLAWNVSFGNGNTNANFKANDSRVRLVRGGQSFDALAADEPPPPPGGTGEPAPIPALQTWGLLLLGTLLGWVGWRTQRRQIG